MSDTLEVKIGASDAGLEATLKTVQAEFSRLDEKVKAGDLSFKEIDRTMKQMAQVNDLEEKLRGMGAAAGEVTNAFQKANPSVSDLGSEIERLKSRINQGNLSIDEMKQSVSELSSLKRLEQQIAGVRDEFAKVDEPVKKFENVIKSAGDIAMTVDQRLASVSREITDLREHAKTASITVDQFENTMKKIAQLESTEKRLKSMGSEAADAAPKIDAMGRELQGVGEKATGIGGFFDSSFQKIAGAVSLGNIAAAGFNKAVDLAFTAAQSVVQGFGDALDLGGRLSELSARTGESAGKLLVLETAFKNSGLGAETVGVAINKLQNFMQDATNGGDKQVATMNRLGISLAELQGKTPTEQMQIFADKIAAIDDPTQRAAASSDVFGDKLGGKLLPLLNDFSPALEDAREKVGSMEQVMDENAETFDAAGETIDAVKGKMAAFAAGVLSEVIPAVDNLGASMEKVDAAGLGERVGQYLTPILTDLTDATRGAIAIIGDLGAANTKAANDTGILGTAYRGVTTSLDGFNQMMADAFNKFTPFGYVMETLVGRGKDLRESQDSAAEGIANAGNAAGDASGKIGEVGTASDTATAKVGALGTQADATGESIASSFSLNSEFTPQLEEVASAWGGVNEQVTGNQELLSSNLTYGESIVGKTEEQKQSLGGINEQLSVQDQFAKTIEDTYGKHAEKAAQVAEKQAEIAAKEAERQALAQTTLQTELELAEAKGTGNKEEIEALTQKKEWLDAWKKAIASGMGEEQAAAFANNLGAAKINADNIKVPAFTSAKEDAKEVENALGNSKSFLEAMGKIEKSKAVEEAKLDARAAREEIEAFGKYMQVDLDGMSFPDIAKKLGVDKMGEAGSEQIKTIMNFVSESKDKLSVNPIDSDKFNATWQGIQDKITGKTTIMPLEANTTTAEEQVATLANPKTVSVTADITKAEEQVAGLGGGVAVDLDATESIENIRTSLKEGIELDISAKSGASGLLEQIKGFVEKIQIAVEKIEPKLPVAALIA